MGVANRFAPGKTIRRRAKSCRIFFLCVWHKKKDFRGSVYTLPRTFCMPNAFVSSAVFLARRIKKDAALLHPAGMCYTAQADMREGSGKNAR